MNKNNFEVMKIDGYSDLSDKKIFFNKFNFINEVCNFLGKKGMPDFFIMNEERNGFFVEIKYKNSKLTELQLEKMKQIKEWFDINSYVVKIKKEYLGDE